MFTSKHRVTFGILLLTLCTCSYPGRESSNGGQTSANGETASGVKATDAVMRNKGRPKDFFDSVQLKMRLSFDQIKERTNIDTIYDKEYVRFFGDTVWYRNGRHPLAIIRYNDSTINKKLLLVFNRSEKCTAALMVGLEGDVDRFDSVVLNYKILDNNNFSTTETWTYREGSRNDKVTVTKQFYQINKKGNIMAQNNIIHSFTRPKAIAVNHRH